MTLDTVLGLRTMSPKVTSSYHLLMYSLLLLVGLCTGELIPNANDTLVTTTEVAQVSLHGEHNGSGYRIATTEVPEALDVNSTATDSWETTWSNASNVLCPRDCQCTHRDGFSNSIVINCSTSLGLYARQHLEDFVASNVMSVSLFLNEVDAIPQELCQFIEAEAVTITGLVNVTLDYVHCLSELQVLDLSGGGIERISSGDPARLKIADSVQRNTSHSNVSAESQHLIHLNLSYNSLQSLENDVFAAFGGIEILDTSHNLIASVDDVLGAFLLSKFTHVDLSFNRLTTIDGESLKSAANLLILDLSHNAIVYIQPGLFSCQLPDLQSLNLAHNRLSVLQDFTFSRLHKLRSLDLSHNLLSVVNQSAFDDDPLTTCNSVGGSDGNSSQQSSRPWKQFDTLDLSHNRIASVGQSTFRHSLSNLHTLLLGHNQIRHLPKYGIESLKRLEWLDLQANQIDWLDVGTFTNARLRHINLARNQLRKIISMAFLFLPKIQFIDLSHNHLNYLYKYAFYRICKQEHKLKIFLNDNELGSDVIWKLWQTFRHLEETGCSVQIDLHGNSISSLFQDGSLETIQKHFTLQDVPYFFSWDYLQLALGANPIVCDCVLYSEVQTLSTISKTFKRSLSFPENLDFWKSTSCSTPFIFQNLTIQETLPMLTCPNVKNCPILCDCFPQANNKDVTYVNCSYRNLNIFPEVLPSGAKALDLQGNLLTALPRELNLDNVTYLDLSDNHLITINEAAWKRLTRLVGTVLLNNNQLTDIPRVEGKGLALGAKKLTLAGNPFSCKCGFGWVRGWVINNSRVIADAKAISCSDGRRVILLEKDDFRCSEPDSSTAADDGTESSTSSLNVPALTFAAVLFVCCLVIALLLTFRSHIRGALMKKSNWYKVHIEQEKKYDVFFMLNDCDIAWTERVILSRLNESYTHRVHIPQLKQTASRYHTHAFALEQLQSGLENSKSTIMIASRSFITTELDDDNYVGIIREALQVNKHRLYVVFLDNVQPSDLRPELKQLLKKKSMFYTKDDFFMDRLVQKLPSSGHAHTEAATTSRTGLIHSEPASQDLEDPLGNI